MSAIRRSGIAVLLLVLALGPAGGRSEDRPGDWRSLPEVKPTGRKARTGSYIVKNRDALEWTQPEFTYHADVATKPKAAKVVVLIYNPVLECEGGKTLIEHLNANDPRTFSHILADVMHIASGGYITYDIVDVIEVDGYAKKVDGFRYTDESFMEVRKTQKWQPSPSSYRGMFEENNLLERFQREGITELWVWGAGGMHFDEFAFYIPNRYARYGPTENEWFYRPYDIPEELGRTTWVMGFNYEVGADNMIHSYAHRCESILALQFGHGVWKTELRDADPWNTFSSLEMDNPGKPSHIGNCHVPPNGQSGYDYNNSRKVLSYADNWFNYPDLRGAPRLIGSEEWGNTQYGYQIWWHSHIPKAPGYTKWGYNNWWVYIANTDEELPDREIPKEMILPEAEQETPVAAVPPEMAPNGVDGHAATADPAARGRELYTAQGCNMCHSLDGTKGIAMSLKGLMGSRQKMQDGAELTVDDAFVRESILEPYKRITHGYSAMMPSYKGRLNDQEVNALVEFIRSLK